MSPDCQTSLQIFRCGTVVTRSLTHRMECIKALNQGRKKSIQAWNEMWIHSRSHLGALSIRGKVPVLFIWEREESCEAVEHIDGKHGCKQVKATARTEGGRGDHVGFDRTVFSSILRLWDWATLVENTRSQGTNITMRSYLEQCDRPRDCLAATPPPSNPSPGISPRP